MFMISLAIIFGLFFTAFAVQNIIPVSLTFGSFVTPAIPAYIVILAALLLGVAISWLFAVIDNMTTYFLLNNKEKTIRELKKTVTNLTRRVHQLEIEKDGGNLEEENKEI